MIRKCKAIFLDRDGVLNNVQIKNGKPYPPASVEELIIPPGVYSALTVLRSAGFMLIGATNQPDVARGTTDKMVVETINAALLEQLPLDEIRVCYHDDSDGCECRKPLPGLLTKAAIDHGLELATSVMIGDRWKDIAAGKAAGCRTIWLNQFYDEPKPKVAPDFETTTLLAAAEWLLENRS